jgi:hypothetical protein
VLADLLRQTADPADPADPSIPAGPKRG